MSKVNSSILGILLAGTVAILVFLIGSNWLLIKSFLYPPSGSVNILVLGKGGIEHETPDITDTIIFASISKKKSVLISLPRDIWIPEIRTKLNSAYYYGGLPLAKSTVEKITGQPVKYGLVIDFSGFKNIINVLGGVEVEVKNSFVDEKYPISGKENDPCLPCRYELVKFDKGLQKMDGERALKFVRSRNAEGDEGTDIAREARQQLVIDALKNKILSPGVFLNPRTVGSLKKAIVESVETDMDTNLVVGIARLIFSSRNSVESRLIPEDLLERPPASKKYDNQYVFIPVGGDWLKVNEWIGMMVK